MSKKNVISVKKSDKDTSSSKQNELTKKHIESIKPSIMALYPDQKVIIVNNIEDFNKLQEQQLNELNDIEE